MAFIGAGGKTIENVAILVEDGSCQLRCDGSGILICASSSSDTSNNPSSDSSSQYSSSQDSSGSGSSELIYIYSECSEGSSTPSSQSSTVPSSSSSEPIYVYSECSGSSNTPSSQPSESSSYSSSELIYVYSECSGDGSSVTSSDSSHSSSSSSTPIYVYSECSSQSLSSQDSSSSSEIYYNYEECCADSSSSSEIYYNYEECCASSSSSTPAGNSLEYIDCDHIYSIFVPIVPSPAATITYYGTCFEFVDYSMTAVDTTDPYTIDDCSCACTIQFSSCSDYLTTVNILSTDLGIDCYRIYNGEYFIIMIDGQCYTSTGVYTYGGTPDAVTWTPIDMSGSGSCYSEGCPPEVQYFVPCGGGTPLYVALDATLDSYDEDWGSVGAWKYDGVCYEFGGFTYTSDPVLTPEQVETMIGYLNCTDCDTDTNPFPRWNIKVTYNGVDYIANGHRRQSYSGESYGGAVWNITATDSNPCGFGGGDISPDPGYQFPFTVLIYNNPALGLEFTQQAYASPAISLPFGEGDSYSGTISLGDPSPGPSGCTPVTIGVEVLWDPLGTSYF